MRCPLSIVATAMLALACGAMAVSAAELVTLNSDNWDAYRPRGKEVDCIYGDYVLKNDKIVAVVASPIPGRHVNLTIRNAGGAIIDLTSVDRPNDQLSVFYPGAGAYEFAFVGCLATSADGAATHTSAAAPGGHGHVATAKGTSVVLRCAAKAVKNKPAVALRYTLQDGEPYVLVHTNYSNPHDAAISIDLVDRVRADRVFESGRDEPTKLAWFYDKWFGQAYGVVADQRKIELAKPRPNVKGAGTELLYVSGDNGTVTLAPGKSVEVSRRVFPGRDLFAVKAAAIRLAGAKLEQVTIHVKDDAGPVGEVFVVAEQNKVRYAAGRTGRDGTLVADIPPGKYDVVAVSQGRGEKRIAVDTAAEKSATIELPRPGYVVAKITAADGGPIPCKVQFRRRLQPDRPNLKDDPPPPVEKDKPRPTPKTDPDFGPDSDVRAIRNLVYNERGSFRQEIPPGVYDVVVSHGPEYDAVFTTIEVERGKDAPLAAKILRTVNTPGWISADFHNHASPSGDNVSSQRGRVLNLLCENVEFAPCTEHNRISSYAPHLKALRSEHLMATCTGIELTGALLPVNHQNAFPLVQKPRTQNGGGPDIDATPEVQIERLALWDGGSEKLMQMNHPNLIQILGDRDNDGKPDKGFEKMFGFVDVMEVHPPIRIFTPPTSADDARKELNPIFHWMQMLNAGYRVPGVVNTDAHYNFHGSCWLRNYIKSPTDDPAKFNTLDVVRASQRGNLTMTNGPFLETSVVTNGGATVAWPGDTVAPIGKTMLKIRVQCPNWFDVDRVQVFVNGRPDDKLNFTRRTTPKLFGRDTVRFDAEIPLKLSQDAHVIVSAVGESSSLGIVLGPEWGPDKPIAVANPIYVDVDGGGFQPNGDLLGFPLHHPEKPTHRRGK